MRRGSVLIIVLWICLGLVTLTVYFAYAVNSELQAAANRVGEIEARQAVAGATRYAAYVLNNYAIDGVVPHSGIPPDATQDYDSAALAVGSAKGDPQFWFVGRDPNNPPTSDPVFGLVDETSKLNLNTATAAMLGLLPMENMTPDFASAIVSWRTRQSSAGSGAANNLYSTLDPARLNKGAVFESTDELRLVYGATLDVILGEDTNRNGALDANENDGDGSPPHDNQDGLLQPGMLEFVTAFSNQPNTLTTGGARTNISTQATRLGLATLLRRKGVNAGRITAIVRNVGTIPYRSVAEFMVASKMTPTEFALVHTSITAVTTTGVQGLVNVNTAPVAVLACIPGIGPNNAASIVAYRQANPTALTSFAWLPQVISKAIIARAGPYITDQSYQFSADIAAVGRNGRGYHREKVIFDTSKGIPRIVYRQDLTAYGWALGATVRQSLKTAHLN
jgi:DNA uptake protein ComE-like DNA-binding protein